MANAGGSIRKLAQRRRAKSTVQFLIATVLFASPLLIYSALGAISVSILAHIGCWIGSFILVRKGKALLLSAQRADIGAIAEEAVAFVLQDLEKEGWTAEYNIPLKYWGDADVLLQSPSGRHFVIDVKGNRGSVFFSGAKMMLRRGQRTYPFSHNKDILKAVRGQAVSLKEARGLRFVTPILCFTQAALSADIKNKKVENVQVSTLDSLTYLLRSLG